MSVDSDFSDGLRYMVAIDVDGRERIHLMAMWVPNETMNNKFAEELRALLP